MKVLAIIPARYGSTRLPGKPLLNLGGKSMIQRVYEQVANCSTTTKVVVATDDKRIYKAVKRFGGNCMMTLSSHQSGTERCIEVVEKEISSFDVVINVQGDEPFVQASQLESLIKAFDEANTEIATLKKQIGPEKTTDPNTVKVVCQKNGNALYFSRSAIPFQRNQVESNRYFKHVGIYAYRKSTLLQLKNLPSSVLEQTESLEQLRWLDNGLSIRVLETSFESPSVDTKEDIVFVENFLKKHPEYL